MKAQFEPFSIEIDLLQITNTKPAGRKIRTPMIAAGGVILLMCIIVGWIWIGTNSKLVGAKQDLAQVQSQISQMEAELQKSQFTGSLPQLLKLPGDARSMKPQTTVLLKQFGHLLPEYANTVVLELGSDNTLKYTALFATIEDIVTFTQSVEASLNFTIKKMDTINSVMSNQNGKENSAAVDMLWSKQVSFEIAYKETAPENKEATEAAKGETSS
ncbi:hypothetical protein [Paenibacillus dokdonensis]|uniref:hypothetical protein n=1 Tax=Paenibacillus dokdonensis TaxID=2567944 RepID=UPI0010A839F6|nr:hypothetical protein [Paenibacillus dokdonensis]